MGDFQFEPPDFEDRRQGSDIPMSAEAAWILQLIDIKLNKAEVSDELRKEFIEDITPYIVNASMTWVSRGEILLFLNMFEELWMDFKIFKYRKKNNPHLSYIHTLVTGYLMQNYNKSIEGWQGNHVFEKKHTYDVKQAHSMTTNERRGGILGRRKKVDYMPDEVVQQ